MQICAITGSSGVLGKKIKKLLPFKFYEFKGDITRHKEVNKWINNKNFDLLIHLAAKVPTKEVEQKYQYSLKVNHLGTKNIVKALKSKINKPKWVFFSSTSHVYGLNNKNVTSLSDIGIEFDKEMFDDIIIEEINNVFAK